LIRRLNFSGDPIGVLDSWNMWPTSRSPGWCGASRTLEFALRRRRCGRRAAPVMAPRPWAERPATLIALDRDR
jgi:hypothetical protein